MPRGHLMRDAARDAGRGNTRGGWKVNGHPLLVSREDYDGSWYLGCTYRYDEWPRRVTLAYGHWLREVGLWDVAFARRRDALEALLFALETVAPPTAASLADPDGPLEFGDLYHDLFYSDDEIDIPRPAP